MATFGTRHKQRYREKNIHTETEREIPTRGIRAQETCFSSFHAPSWPHFGLRSRYRTSSIAMPAVAGHSSPTLLPSSSKAGSLPACSDSIVASRDGKIASQDDDDDDDWLMSDDKVSEQTKRHSFVYKASRVHVASVSNGQPAGSKGSGGQELGVDPDSADIGNLYDQETSFSAMPSMETRDSCKMQRTLYDVGYREGITAGKLLTLQAGFDEGFNMSSPLGRARGSLRGQATALHHYLTEYKQQRKQRGGLRGKRQRPNQLMNGADESEGSRADRVAIKATPLGRGVSSRSPSTERVSMSSSATDTDLDKENVAVRQEVLSLLERIEKVGVDTLFEPDWEARKHEAKHAESVLPASQMSESEEQKAVRQAVLPDLSKGMDRVLGEISF